MIVWHRVTYASVVMYKDVHLRFQTRILNHNTQEARLELRIVISCLKDSEQGMSFISRATKLDNRFHKSSNIWFHEQVLDRTLYQTCILISTSWNMFCIQQKCARDTGDYVAWCVGWCLVTSSVRVRSTNGRGPFLVSVSEQIPPVISSSIHMQSVSILSINDEAKLSISSCHIIQYVNILAMNQNYPPTLHRENVYNDQNWDTTRTGINSPQFRKTQSTAGLLRRSMRGIWSILYFSLYFSANM